MEDELPLISMGKGALKPAKRNLLEKFLSDAENPDAWRTLPDNHVLTREEIDMVRSILRNEYADLGFEEYQPFEDFFTQDVMIMPLCEVPDAKSRFIPSKDEAKVVLKLIKAIREGKIVPNREKKKEDERAAYDIWANADSSAVSDLIAPPKMRLPDNSESYNPAEEYLLTPEEMEEYYKTPSSQRDHNYVPQKYSSLRKVPAYPNLIDELYSRCLDLYLCPRVTQNRLDVSPDLLLPKLPDPKDLRPFPSLLALEFSGHSEIVTCISVSPSGEWLASGSKDGTVIVWDASNARPVKELSFESSISALEWNPSPSLLLLCIAANDKVHIVDPNVATETVLANNRKVLDSAESNNNSSCMWSVETDGITIDIASRLRSISWHRKGDYLVTVSHAQSPVIMHMLSKSTSKSPFKIAPNSLGAVVFNPTSPQLALVQEKNIRIFDLQKQSAEKKLEPGFNTISALAIHPSGKHYLVASYENNLCWIDSDLSTKPYKSLYFHKAPVRSVAFSPSFPLFASCAEDGHVHVYHGHVPEDIVESATIVPLKILKCTLPKAVHFHPTQPWLFVASLKSIKLFT